MPGHRSRRERQPTIVVFRSLLAKSAQCEVASGRGSGDEVEKFADWCAGAAFNLRDHHPGDDASNATTIDGENLHVTRLVGITRGTLQGGGKGFEWLRPGDAKLHVDHNERYASGTKLGSELYVCGYLAFVGRGVQDFRRR